MPRMRTIREAAQLVRAADPDTALTETAIRRLLTTSALPSVRVGVKYLLDIDTLEAFLAGGSRAMSTEAAELARFNRPTI